MIFAELQYDQPYSEVHEPLVALLGRHFPKVRAGLQSDSWVWVLDNDQKVTIDTFTSRHHQVKSTERSSLVNQVIAVLAPQYRLRLLDPPEFEAHEWPEQS